LFSMNGCRQTVLAIYNDEGLRFRIYKTNACSIFVYHLRQMPAAYLSTI